jgi:para-nitrobenzyl esterase
VWRWIETLPASALPYDVIGTSSFAEATSYEKVVTVSSWLQYQGPIRDLASAYSAAGRAVTTRTFTHRSPVEGQLSGHCLDLPFQFGTREEWADAPMLRGCSDDTFDALSHQLIRELVDFAGGLPLA